jgi:quercetin dioxygenase-like cupin family protein
VTALAAAPLGAAMAPPQATPPRRGPKVAAGADRFVTPRKLPSGSQLFVKVASAESSGAFFLTEQVATTRGDGPPKHFHQGEDEWFYCLAGQFVMEVGSERFTLEAGDSVLVPRKTPHAFAFAGGTPGRLLVGFTPAGRMEEFFSDLVRRGQYFGTGTAEDKEIALGKYGIQNVGPPLKL